MARHCSLYFRPNIPITVQSDSHPFCSCGRLLDWTPHRAELAAPGDGRLTNGAAFVALRLRLIEETKQISSTHPDRTGADPDHRMRPLQNAGLTGHLVMMGCRSAGSPRSGSSAILRGPGGNTHEQISLQSVLDDLTVLHDDDEILRRIFDQLDVGNRVAVDKQEIGKCALLDHTELAGIRIALAGQRQ